MADRSLARGRGLELRLVRGGAVRASVRFSDVEQRLTSRIYVEHCPEDATQYSTIGRVTPSFKRKLSLLVSRVNTRSAHRSQPTHCRVPGLYDCGWVGHICCCHSANIHDVPARSFTCRVRGMPTRQDQVHRHGRHQLAPTSLQVAQQLAPCS